MCVVQRSPFEDKNSGVFILLNVNVETKNTSLLAESSGRWVGPREIVWIYPASQSTSANLLRLAMSGEKVGW